jgi:hypothetical protein
MALGPKFITISSAKHARALRLEGIALPHLYGELVSILQSRLGAQHAAYLARPVDMGDGQVCWESSGASPIVALDNLEPARAAALLRRAQQIEADIVVLSDRLLREGGDAARFGQALRMTLRRPSGQWLFMAGVHPVVACWAHESPGPTSRDARPHSAAAALSEVGTNQGVSWPPTSAERDPDRNCAEFPGSTGVAAPKPARSWAGAATLGLVLAAFAGTAVFGSRVYTSRSEVARSILMAEAELASLEAEGARISAELIRRRSALQCPSPAPDAAPGTGRR